MNNVERLTILVDMIIPALHVNMSPAITDLNIAASV